MTLDQKKSVGSQLLHQSTSEKIKNRLVGLHQNQKLSFMWNMTEKGKRRFGMKGYICKPQKGLVSSTYEELLNSAVKRLIAQLKMGKDLNVNLFSKEDKQMANKYIESCSTSLVIRKCPSKITTSYHLKPIRTV